MKRDSLLLAFGAAAGVAAAATGLMGTGDVGLPASAVARVNGEIIRLDEYRRALDGLGRDRREALDDAARRYVLDRLVDEELLVQRGLELGLARRDGKVRAELSAAVIEAAVSGENGAPPSDAELAKFYEEERAFFAEPGRLRARQLVFRVSEDGAGQAALERAARAARRLRDGEGFSEVRKAADAEVAELPDALLPVAKLRDYLGPTVLQSALALEAGEVSEPILSPSGYHVLAVIERQGDRSPELDEVRPQVLAEYRRRAGERALRAYLDELRVRAKITVAPTVP